LGGQCAKCGAKDIRALEIACTDPFEKHASGLGHYYKVQREISTGHWRVLCANCNALAKDEAAVPAIRTNLPSKEIIDGPDEEIKNRIRKQIKKELLADLEDKVEKAFKRWKQLDDLRIAEAVSSVLSPARRRGSRTCTVCGLQGAKAGGRWKEKHDQEEHRAAIVGPR